MAKLATQTTKASTDISSLEKISELYLKGSTTILSDMGEEFTVKLKSTQSQDNFEGIRMTIKKQGDYIAQGDASLPQAPHPIIGGSAQRWALMDCRLGVDDRGSLVPSKGTGAAAVEVSERSRAGYSGIGRTLVMLLAGVAKIKGADIMVVDSVSKSAKAFYEKLGFKEQEVTLDGKPRTAFVLPLGSAEYDLAIKTRKLS